MSRYLHPAFLIVFLLSLNACTEYWWTRGQAPSTTALYKQANTRYDEAMAKFGTHRGDITSDFDDMRRALDTALSSIERGESSDKIASDLRSVSDLFIRFEGRLSVGSRAPLGELSKQSMKFVDRSIAGTALDSSAFRLFASRTIFFLSSELSVPAPTFG